MSTEFEPKDHAADRTGRVRHRLGFIGLVLVAFVVGVAFASTIGIGVTTHPDEFTLIADSWELLQGEYVDAKNIDPSDLAHGAIRGMADAVGDTGHTHFLAPEEAAFETETMTGGYGGIGVDFGVAGYPDVISALVPGAPASVAGLRVDDKVIEVDGTSTSGPDAEQVLGGIAGAPGTEVSVAVERPGHADPLTFRIMRDVIDRDATDWAMIPGGTTALIQLTDFPDGAASELRAAVSAATAAGATGLVLDLRWNPGGFVQEAIGVAGVFLPAGDAVYRERLADGTETTEVVPAGADPTELPLVVLVDGESASAAEVVAGALKDAERAMLVGTKTFGTGTILTDYSLADGSDLAIGTSRWLTPAGRSAWHFGLTPDVTVELPIGGVALTPDMVAELSAEQVAAAKDAQLLRALEVLRAP